MRMKHLFLTLLVLFSFLPLSFAQAQRPIVRFIYFLPRDRAPQPDINAKMDRLIKDVQRGYADIMEGHGFGRKTFRIETDTSGNAVVHHIAGRFTDKHYSELSSMEVWGEVWREIDGRFDTSKNIYLTAIDISSEGVPGDGACGGRGGSTGAFGGGRALIPAFGHCFNVGITAHELGHAFGLQHDARGDAKRVPSHISDWMVASFCAAEWLDAHRAFNADQSSFNELPTIRMLAPSFASPPNAIRFRFKVTDLDGLHQVQLHTLGDDGYNLLLGCKRLSGTSNRTVEIVTSHLRSNNRSVSLQMIDVHGNLFWSESYPINVISLLPRPKVVSIPDANLATAVRREIGSSITTHTMLNLTWLEVPNRRITYLTGLEHARNLSSLNLGNEYIDGVGPVNSNAVSDISSLSDLKQLGVLSLGGNAISDISSLSGLTQLGELDLSNNTISDVSLLSGLTQLWGLNLSNNTISDVSSLSGLTQLRWLFLIGNTISDVSSLSGLKQLTFLDLSNNTISDVSSLSDLKQLTSLSLRDNTISDVSSLSGLKQLTFLDLSNNTISDVSSLSDLKQLTFLSLGGNAISDVSLLSGLKQLTQLYLYNNNISDVSPLIPLNLTGTEWDSTGLALWGNLLNYASINTHIPAMQARGIEVKFDNRIPTTLVKISRAAQQGVVNTVLPLPFVVEVKDQRNRAFAGVSVTFAVTAGGGRLSTTSTTTDLKGKAQAHLTLGRTAGTTTVRVTAAKISQPLQFTATATLLGTPITMPDANLRAKVVVALGKVPEHSITVADMLTLTVLAANNANIHGLTGLQYASNLKTLSLDNNNVSDVAPLEALTQLETLSLDNNNISDVTPLARLTQLQTLSLDDNNISDVASLEALTRLKTLQLRGNSLSYPSYYKHIRAIQTGGAVVRVDTRTPTTLVKVSGTHGVAGSALAVIVEVQDKEGVGFSGVPVTFTVTAGGGHLSVMNVITDGIGRTRTTLTLGSRPGKNTLRVAAAEAPLPISFTITAIDPNSSIEIPDASLHAKIVETLGKQRGAQLTAGDMLALRKLDVRNASVQDLTGLENAHNLYELNLGGESLQGKGYVNSNTVSDFSRLEGLSQLTYLYLSNNDLADVSSLSGLSQLIVLDLSNNIISDVSPLSELSQLTYLYLSNNDLADISLLSGLSQLKSLYLSSNELTDISPLSGLSQLTNLNLSSTGISDISLLSGLSQLKSLYLSSNELTDISPLSGLSQLTYLSLGNNTIADISPLSGLSQLTNLNLSSTGISDISPLSGLSQLTNLNLGNNTIADISPLSGLSQLTYLYLHNNTITDVSPLVGLNLTGTEWDSIGLYIWRNPLSYASINTHIPAMQAKGIEVKFDNRAYPTLLKISGDGQEGLAGKALAAPFVVEVQDENGEPMSSVTVTFVIEAGGGVLNTTKSIPDADGKARTTLTLGWTPGTTTIRATATGISSDVRFTATTTVLTDRIVEDVNADGSVDVDDLVLVAASFGAVPPLGALPDTDVNNDGEVNEEDIVLVLVALEAGPAAPSLVREPSEVWTAERLQGWISEAKHRNIGDETFQRGIAVLEQLLDLLLPKETALLANYPNPFNPETWIPYQLAADANVRLTIYNVHGVPVRALDLGHQPAGMYHSRSRAAYWDGRNEQGERVASGVYFYTLSAGDFTTTRKMLIRK